MAAKQLAPKVGLVAACAAFALCRASFYRQQRPKLSRSITPSPRAISSEERRMILDTLNSPSFVDKAPQAVYAMLLDRGIYLCSPRSMYRFLADANQIRERRDQVRRPRYTAPQLMATGPNQLWSWDITKLRGDRPYLYYFLYTMLDVFSRYVVGWMVAEKERADLAQVLIADCCARQDIKPGQLTIHSDRGAPMIAKPVALLMDQLGVRRSHSRPHVSDDNPFIESHFKTFKYHHQMDKKFGCVAHARQSSREFYRWYNYEHRHSGIAYLTPASVHHGSAQAVLKRRHQTQQLAYQKYPERFVRGAPARLQAPAAVWINPPRPQLLSSPSDDPLQQTEISIPQPKKQLTGGELMQ